MGHNRDQGATHTQTHTLTSRVGLRALKRSLAQLSWWFSLARSSAFSPSKSSTERSTPLSTSTERASNYIGEEGGGGCAGVSGSWVRCPIL